MNKTPLLLLLILTTFSCVDKEPIHQTVNNNPDITHPEPKYTGFTQGGFVYETAEALASFTVPNNLANIIDLSHLMPPILNQGEQSSNVAFATTYYLKSYQEKIQHGYQYISNFEVMSPSFVYNQTKESENCSEGTNIENALYILKSKGVNNWEEFPYSEDNCTNLPTTVQLEFAEQNKITTYHNVLDNTMSSPLINILKTLLTQGKPIVIGIKIDNNFKSALPKVIDFDNNPDNDIYVYNNCDLVNNDNHAMLIVGYDDNYRAFKVINSWGESWANEGFAYISYNFFKQETTIGYKEGLLELYIAYDAL